jgi:hypothetical protein
MKAPLADASVARSLKSGCVDDTTFGSITIPLLVTTNETITSPAVFAAQPVLPTILTK